MTFMLRALPVAALLCCSTLAFADASAEVAAGKRIAAAIKCGAGSQDPLRTFCPATLQTTDAVALPAAMQTYFGVTLELGPTDNVRKAVIEKVSASALHIGPGGALVTWIKPSNPDEEKQMAEAIFNTAGVLKGMMNSVEVPAGLYGFLKSQEKKPLHPITIAKSGKVGEMTARMPSRVYHTPAAWIIVEDAGPKGLFINVFPTTPLKSK